MPLTLLVTSPRVAPGLLSWAGWQAVAGADRVLASDAASPVARAVAASGHRVDVLPDATVDDVLTAAATGQVVWLADDAEATSFPGTLAERIVAATGEEPLGVEVLHASYDVPGARLLDLVTVMDRLRDGCPWDREQTHESLAKYLLEETYETLEAIESGDYTHLREELGDLLLQVYFHARIASEDPDDPFDVDDVAGGIVDKLVHRHPHVFALAADEEPPSRDEVERSWESLKASEKRRVSVLDGVPLALPALALADKVLGRAGRSGVGPRPAVSATPATPGEASGAPLGDRLLALVVEARDAGLDAEQELRAAVRRLADEVRRTEAD